MTPKGGEGQTRILQKGGYPFLKEAPRAHTPHWSHPPVTKDIPNVLDAEK